MARSISEGKHGQDFWAKMMLHMKNGGSGGMSILSAVATSSMVLIKLIQGQPNRYKFEGATLFKFMVPMERAEERFNTLEALFERLIPKSA